MSVIHPQYSVQPGGLFSVCIPKGIIIYLPIHSAIIGHLGSFHFGAISNNDTHSCKFLYMLSVHICTCLIETAWPKVIYNIFRYYQTIFQGYNLQTHQQHTVVLVLYISNSWCCDLLHFQQSFEKFHTCTVWHSSH